MTALLLATDGAARSADDLSAIRAAAPSWRVVPSSDPVAVEACATDIEVVAGWLPPERLLALPSLRWYQQWIAGAEWLMQWPEAVEHPFVLTNASGVAAAVVAEQVFGYVLAFTRRLRQAWRAQHQALWHRAPADEFVELAGKTLLVAGVGALGSRIAKLARGFDLRVLGVRRDPAVPAEGFDAIGGPRDLASLLAEADVVVSALPLTRETHHLFDARAFAAMKPSALFVSVGRGRVVDEDAVVSALRAGRLAGAALDVFEHEPLPADSPLWSLEAAMVTAHRGAAFPHTHQRTMALLCDNLRRYLAGAPLHNRVDKRRGY